MNEFSGTKRVGIIGAGIAGLAAAYDLTRQGCAVTIFEGAPVAGGLASGFKADTWQWPLERFYHHLFTSDSDIIRLTQEIGCQDLLIFRRPITSMWYQGKPYAFDSPLRLLAFPHLDWPNKFRMGFVFAYLRYVGKNWRAFEQTTSHAWLDRWMGPRGYNMLWRPMLEGKFGDHYQEVNLAWFWARIVKRSPRLGYFQGGFQAFVDALIARVTAQGAVVHLDSRVTNVRPAANRTLIVSHDRGEDTFDAVIATVSPSQMAALAPDLPAAYLGQLGQLKSMGAVVMTLALKHSLMPDTSGTAGGFLARVGAHQPGLPARLGARGLGTQGHLRAAGAAGQLLCHDPAAANTHPRPLLRQHEPGLPLGSGHQLCGGNRPSGGAAGSTFNTKLRACQRKNRFPHFPDRNADKNRKLFLDKP